MDGSTPGGDTLGTEQDVIGLDVENLYGGAAADMLVGNDNDNDIEGNGGGDTLCGGLGNDTLLGNRAVGDSTVLDGAILHGGDCADDTDPGYNICLNTGTAGAFSPATAGLQNCELISH
jgi:Ca2+-binding RTX toxin-like protein